MNKYKMTGPSYRRGAILLFLLIWNYLSVAGQGTQRRASSGLESVFEVLRYRSVGPTRGGRVTAVTGVPDQPFTFYMGSTGGGVWKTTDAGLTWKNVSDGFFHVGSIGAVSIAPSDPDIIYVGTGSACPRGNVSQGNGVYRSADGGNTWKHLGLENAGLIGKIAVHPQRPDLVYVAALGQIFGPNSERGLYRSRDGGKHWDLLLHVSDSTGAIDLAMNPNNPQELYVAFWRVERKPWTLIDGGREGGIWKTTDGGEHWEKLRNGLPGGLLGRIGLAISPANPQRVWAIIQTPTESTGGLYRSDNAGKDWSRINRNHNLRQRGWYYSHLTAHPTDENTVYSNNVNFLKSIDGGKTFGHRIAVPHGDCHDLWINPNNTDLMIHGNDGGACITLNGGETWSSQLNQPTAEFYRLTIDDQFPYRLYGAQQDNSTISVPSRYEAHISPQEKWYAVGGGESGHIAVHPNNPDLIYAGTYIGQITLLNRLEGRVQNAMAYPQMHDGTAPRDIRYRFQWNAPIRISPHDPKVVYHCSQFVHRTQDQGKTWEIISPDLTTNDDRYHDIPGGPIQHDHTGVELYCTIFAFEVSPHRRGELWAGSDDGLVHLSTDEGKHWEDITPKQMPKGATINTIELSAHAPGRAFLAAYRYRENDFRPYVFMTTDYGKSWKILTDGENGIPPRHFVRVVREDPARRGLLYAGTEFGMYLSLDEGENWMPFQQNLPITPITDLAIKNSDLVVATQGRSFWILDDLSPLRIFSEQITKKSIHLFAPQVAYRTQLHKSGAPDPAPQGAIIYFYLRDDPRPGQKVSLTVLDKENNVRTTYSSHPGSEQTEQKLRVRKGLNRLEWDLRYEAPKLEKNAVFSLANVRGVTALTGVHTIQLTVEDNVFSQTLAVRKDPRWTVSDEDLVAQYQLTMKIKTLLNKCHATIGKVRSLKIQLRKFEKLTRKEKIHEEYRPLSKQITTKLTALENELIQTKSESSQDPINFPPMLDDQIAYLYSVVNNLDGRPNAGAYERYEDLQRALKQHLDEFKSLVEGELRQINDLLKSNNIDHIILSH